MQNATKLGLLFLCLGVSLPSAAQSRQWTEKTLVKQLNEASRGFRSLTASLEYTKVTVVVDHKSTETGRLYYSKNRKVKIELLHPEPREILLTRRKAEIYYPKMSLIQEFDFRKHRGLVEQFLLLGFGTSGDSLRKSYLITPLGETRLEGNPNPVLQVKLTPKDERIRNQIHEIQLWLDMASWVPVQQKFFEVGGDFLLTRYKNVKVNVRIASSKLKLSAPRGTARVRPRDKF